METNLPTPFSARVYVNLPEGTGKTPILGRFCLVYSNIDPYRREVCAVDVSKLSSLIRFQLIAGDAFCFLDMFGIFLSPLWLVTVEPSISITLW